MRETRVAKEVTDSDNQTGKQIRRAGRGITCTWSVVMGQRESKRGEKAGNPREEIVSKCTRERGTGCRLERQLNVDGGER